MSGRRSAARSRRAPCSAPPAARRRRSSARCQDHGAPAAELLADGLVDADEGMIGGQARSMLNSVRSFASPSPRTRRGDEHEDEPGMAHEPADVPIEDAHRPKVSFSGARCKQTPRSGPMLPPRGRVIGRCPHEIRRRRAQAGRGFALANYWVLGQLGGPTLCGPCAAICSAARSSALALAGVLPARRPRRRAVAASRRPRPRSRASPRAHARLLASLQEDGRLVDFLTEEIASYPTSRSVRPRVASTAPAPRRCAPAARSSRCSGREDDAITVPAASIPRPSG